MRKLGYARVSTQDQDLRLQMDALVSDGVPPENIYREQVSGAARKRPQFHALMAAVGPGDMVVVWKLDRLGRTAVGLLRTAEAIHERGARLRVLTQQIDTSTPAGALMMHMLAAFAQFERDLAIERTVAGVAAARARGRMPGPKRRITDEQVLAAERAVLLDGGSWVTQAQALRVSVQHLARLRKRVAQQASHSRAST